MIKSVLTFLVAAILIWDFISSGPKDSAMSQAISNAYSSVGDLAENADHAIHDYKVRRRLRATEREQALAIAEVESLDGEDGVLDETPILPTMSSAPDNEIGDSVFSRRAINKFIAEASAKTDIPENYLAHLAERESAFDPVAAAGTSSAKGLYQFTEATWLDMFARYGPEHGFHQHAGYVTYDSRRRPTVSDERLKRRILNLRYDPKLSTFMAAHYAQEQQAYLTDRLNREPNHAELYIAHFLGAGGAAKLFIANETRPGADAVKMFPAAARANRRFFFDRNGKAVNIATLHENLMNICRDLAPDQETIQAA
jgi:hypothetical protein